MTSFKIYSDALDMWMHQNNADYTGDFFEGCLLDNFIVSTKNGFAAFYEYALNTWSSCYSVDFVRNTDDNQVIALFDDFYTRKEFSEGEV